MAATEHSAGGVLAVTHSQPTWQERVCEMAKRLQWRASETALSIAVSNYPVITVQGEAKIARQSGYARMSFEVSPHRIAEPRRQFFNSDGYWFHVTRRELGFAPHDGERLLSYPT